MVWKNNQRLFAINFHPLNTTPHLGRVISGMSTQAMPGNPEILAEVSAGEIYPGAASLQSLRPVASFTSFDLAGLLDSTASYGPGININGNNCIHANDSAPNEPGLELFYALYQCAGPAANGAGVFDHTKYTIPEGIIVPTTLTVDHRGNAQISYDIYATAPDEMTDPVIKIKVDSDDLPTHSNNNLRYTMAGMSITGPTGSAVMVEGKRNITFNFNPAVTQEGADSLKFDSVNSIDSSSPRVTIQGVEPDWLKDTAATKPGDVTSLTGHSVVEAETWVDFEERNGLSPTNIRIAFNGLLNVDNIVSGGPDSPAEMTIAIDVVQVAAGQDPFVITPTP